MVFFGFLHLIQIASIFVIFLLQDGRHDKNENVKGQ